MTKADLANHHARWDPPHKVNYRGVDVWGLSPNSQGLATLQMLNIMETFDFKTMGCDVGSAVTVELTYPSAIPAGAQYWKYGPQPGKAASWYAYPATFGANTVTYTLTDGLTGDDDLAANGVIADPGGFGVAQASADAVPVPTQSEWMLALLALLLTVLAWRQAPYRRGGAARNTQREH